MAKKKKGSKNAGNKAKTPRFSPAPFHDDDITPVDGEVLFTIDKNIFSQISKPIDTKNEAVDRKMQEAAKTYEQQRRKLGLQKITDSENQSQVQIYSDALQKFGIADNHETLMGRNLIDLREIAAEKIRNTELYSRHCAYMFSRDQMFFNIIPCFREGTMIEPQHSLTTWRLEDIDIDNMVYRVKIQNYEHWSEDMDPVLINSYVMTVRAVSDPDDPDSVRFETSADTDTLFDSVRLSASINPNALFPPAQALFWKHILQNVIKTNDDRMRDAVHLPKYLFSQFSFLHNVSIINMILSTKHARKPAEKVVQTMDEQLRHAAEMPPRTVKTGTSEEIPDRVIRTVGVVTFVSDVSPRKPSRSNIIKYIMPVWSVRGHVRHYKSGKTAYIPPHEKHRKAFKDASSSSAPQQIIRIVNNLPEDGQELIKEDI